MILWNSQFAVSFTEQTRQQLCVAVKSVYRRIRYIFPRFEHPQNNTFYASRDGDVSPSFVGKIFLANIFSVIFYTEHKGAMKEWGTQVENIERQTRQAGNRI